MNIEECELAWNERHKERGVAFLIELREIEQKHKCKIIMDIDREVNNGFYVVYEDPTCSDIYVQICPTIVNEVYNIERGKAL